MEFPSKLVKNFQNRLDGTSVLSFHFAAAVRRSFESFISGDAGNYGFQAFRKSSQIRAQDLETSSFSEVQLPLGSLKADPALH